MDSYTNLATVTGMFLTLALIGMISQLSQHVEQNDPSFIIGIILIVVAFFAFALYSYGFFLIMEW